MHIQHYSMSRITIKDIARLLDINPSTVSRALKDHPDISLETREKVRELSRSLGYRPNVQAVHFRKQRSGLIALLIPDMNMFFFPPVIEAIEELTHNNGYNLIVLQSQESLHREVENADICRQLGVEGVLVSLTKETVETSHLDRLAENGTPVVYFDRVLDYLQVPKVIIHDELAAYQATTHLIGRGYRRLCGLFGNPNLSISQQRYQGFRRALSENGLTLYPHLLLFANSSEQGCEALLQLWQSNQKPDAIFAMSDELLVGSMEAIYQLKLQIPQELALIAISTGEMPRFMNPPTTYLEHSGYQVGKSAAALLFEMLEGKAPKTHSPRQIEVVTRLVVQAST